DGSAVLRGRAEEVGSTQRKRVVEAEKTSDGDSAVADRDLVTSQAEACQLTCTVSYEQAASDDQAGAPASGLRVYLRSLDSAAELVTGVTDGEGVCRLVDVRAGDYEYGYERFG